VFGVVVLSILLVIGTEKFSKELQF